MQDTNFFLRTKLLPPRAVSDLLKRPRLTDKLRSNLGSSITLIAADAGCGKTTLIADFLREEDRPSVWYQLDHTDADPIVFLNYLAHGIRSIEPDFGSSLFPYLADADEDLLRFPEHAADLLLNEMLDSIEHPFVLVLDDYHHIGIDTPVHKIVDRILMYSSELLHLIITTRDLPPLAIMKRRTQDAALVIRREELLFTDDEVKQLFRNTLNIDLGPEKVAEFRDRTHGWVTALQLVRQIAEREMTVNGDSPDLGEILYRSERDIFDYFAEEVFSREDEDVQRLLLFLSLLETMPLEQCSRIFPDMRCAAYLPALAQKNIFLTVVGDAGQPEEYRFHPLFRDFLLRRLRSEIGHSSIDRERNRIAEALLKDKKWEAALPFLIQAENFERAAAVLAERGSDWIQAGAIVALASFLDAIPDDVLSKYPRALLLEAEIARLQGDTSKPVLLLNQAAKLFSEQDDPFGEAEALHSLASIARRRSKTAEALNLLSKAEELVPKDSLTYLKCANTRGLCMIADGNWGEAEQQFRMALDLAEKQSNENYIRLIAHNLALPPGFRGDFGEAIRWFNRIFREDMPEKRLPQEAIGHLNVARLHLYRGEFEQTESHLERSLELSQLFNLRSLLPEVLEAYANYYRDRQDFVHAAEYYERARNAYSDAGIDIATREFNEEYAKFVLACGDPIKARSLLEALVEARRELGNQLGQKTAELCLCEVDLVEGKNGSLAHKIEPLLTFFREQDHHYDEAIASLLLAEALFASGRKREILAPVRRALDLAARFDYEFWLRNRIAANPAMFEFEDVFEILPGDLKAVLRKPPASAPRSVDVALTIEPESVTDLTVRVLGPIEIFRDPTRPFAADAWTTRRAREIFCYIATSTNHRVTKDALIDTFWGDEDPDSVEKNFHPTISHIRKALNSRQGLKQNFLLFREGAYQLNPQYNYSIDTDDLISNIEGAEEAKREGDDDALRKHLETAHSLYRGDFMSEQYEHWADERRNFFREQYTRVLNDLARLSVRQKRWADAMRFAKDVLAIDPYREDLHRLVLKVLAAQGKPAAVKKHFGEMEELLRVELGIKPAAKTRKLFDELMKK